MFTASRIKSFTIYVAAILSLILIAGTVAGHFTAHSAPNSPTIVQTIHNVSYHGMTCTETIDSTGNSFMDGCTR